MTKKIFSLESLGIEKEVVKTKEDKMCKRIVEKKIKLEKELKQDYFKEQMIHVFQIIKCLLQEDCIEMKSWQIIIVRN